jgi:hypothetical protein
VLFQPRKPEDDGVFAELGDKEWYVLSVAVNGQRTGGIVGELLTRLSPVDNSEVSGPV